MVIVRVGDEGEIEQRDELVRAPMLEVDGEERIPGLDDVAHVVHAPHRRNVAGHDRLPRLAQNLVKGHLKSLQRFEFLRVSVAEVCEVAFWVDLASRLVPFCHKLALALFAPARRRGRREPERASRRRQSREAERPLQEIFAR